MTPTGKAKAGWHIPGKEYCGPPTNLSKAGEPSDSVDNCSRQHDKHYATTGVITEAERELIDCVGPEHKIGRLFAGQQILDEATNNASDSIFRRGVKRQLTGPEISRLRARDKRIREAKREATQK